jgi:hypothetical protein
MSDEKRPPKAAFFRVKVIELRGAAPTALDCLYTVHPALPGLANSFRAYSAGETPKTIASILAVALRQLVAFTFWQ